MASSATLDLWETIAVEAERESPLWGAARRLDPEREVVFSPLAEDPYALGIETIYEGYLLHYGRPRVFEPVDADTRLLLGDYLYAHGLVRISALGSVDAVADLAELIALCAQLQADGGASDGEAWAATAALLGTRRLADARAVVRERGDTAALGELARAAAGEDPVSRALAAHRARLR